MLNWLKSKQPNKNNQIFLRYRLTVYEKLIYWSHQDGGGPIDLLFNNLEQKRREQKPQLRPFIVCAVVAQIKVKFSKAVQRPHEVQSIRSQMRPCVCLV